jgi:hypothetical protein
VLVQDQRAYTEICGEQAADNRLLQMRVDNVDLMRLADLGDGPDGGRAVSAPLQRDDLGLNRQWFGIGAQGADEALDAVHRHPLDDAFDDKRGATVTQMIDHM